MGNKPTSERQARPLAKLSSRAIAELCGVDHQLVQQVKPQVDESSTSTVTGTDGKQYPATR